MDKTALYPLSYGLYVIGVKNDFCEFGGCVVDALMQISSGNTPQIAVSCMKNNNTPAMIEKYGKFTVSVLGRAVDPFVLSCFGFQSGKNSDKWAAVERDFADGLPVLKKAVSYLICTKTRLCLPISCIIRKARIKRPRLRPRAAEKSGCAPFADTFMTAKSHLKSSPMIGNVRYAEWKRVGLRRNDFCFRR